MEHTANILQLNRKPIFDAVRHLVGRSFSQGEVDLLDRAIDLALGACGQASSHALGNLSERFESGGHGPGAVSGGSGDPGGVSYGLYQLSSRTGAVARFLESEGAAWARDFETRSPGDEAFSRAWRQVAGREPQAFAAAQRTFIERTHYRPAVGAVFEETGVDLDSRHRAIRESAWSVAVQHGRAARILAEAVRIVDGQNVGDDRASFDRALIEAIYERRSAYVLRVAGRAGAAAARTLRSIVRNRYPAELKAALAMLEE